MLIFIDESWQERPDGQKIGVLAAVQIKAHDFNLFSREIYKLKVQHLGYDAGNCEMKGNKLFRNYLFELEKKGIRSADLELVRSVFGFLYAHKVKVFASIVHDKEEIHLTCKNAERLERPFFFLFERINIYMEENHPALMGHIIFDDRGLQDNTRISIGMGNFFYKSNKGQTFERIIKVPSFSISTNNIGLQVADMVAYLLARRCVDPARTMEFEKLVKKMEFISNNKYPSGNGMYPYYGFKDIREKKKEAGDLTDPGRI